MADSRRGSRCFQPASVDELRAELLAERKSLGKSKKHSALKRIIANATMGNDMSALFADVVACMDVQVLGVKKLVYIYVANYGRVNAPLLAQCIPHFLKDCRDRNPLIRALALRTMSYIQTPATFEALVEPLWRALHESDAYVRKTAAICVAKMHARDAALVEQHGFVAALESLLGDANASVVANAVVALVDIAEHSEAFQLNISAHGAAQLVQVLDGCSEWGQAYILEALMFYVPPASTDAEHMAERVSVRLQHANSAVVLGCVKVILYLMNYIASAEFKEMLCRRMSPPLVTLLSGPPEIQYVALRNILLIIQRRPLVLQHDVKVFFCKYNDPIYVKTTKLEIIYRLVTPANVALVLPELREYASEVDVEFVRKAVRSIGRVALRLESAAGRCVDVLTEIVQTRVPYAVQEAVVMFRDILHRYPARYLGVLPLLCESADLFDEPQARNAFIWILGEHADRIDSSDEFLDDYLYSFLEEPTDVRREPGFYSPQTQLALLTATVKLFLKRPSAGSELVPKVLKWATEDVVDPDCRDRGFLYWRLLSRSPEQAQRIVFAPQPPVDMRCDRMDREQLNQLLLHASSLAVIQQRQLDSVLHSAKPRVRPVAPPPLTAVPP